jgi:endonuclease G, mitochondrial
MLKSRFLVYLLGLVLVVTSCKKSTDDTPPPTTNPPAAANDNDPLLPGNPSNASTSVAAGNNYLKDNGYYKIAYNKFMGVPNWVAWHLESGDIGSTPRQDDFRNDIGLPAGWYQVQTTDYNGAGFDRGHNCPSADRTSSVSANSSTFLMTNIFPQAPNLNQGPWEGLESFVRNTLVGTSNEAFIFMGNYGSGGYGINGATSTIAGGNINVPAKVWKVVLIIPKGNGDLARIHSNATVLTVSMPNDNRLFTVSDKNAWRNYLISINALETESNAAFYNLNLFQNIHDSIKSVLKTKVYF